MTQVTFAYLADYPHLLEDAALLNYAQWGVIRADRTFSELKEHFACYLNKDKVPLLLCMLNADKQLVGIGALDTQDGDTFPKKTPWITSIYIHPRYRGQGLAYQLIQRLEIEAKKVGETAVYLKSSNAPDMYKKMGFEIIDQKETPLSTKPITYLLYKSLA